MSSWSAFGFSGFDPIGSLVEGGLGEFFGRRAADYSAKSQLSSAKEYAEWAAKNQPKLTREGLVDAGYNPMLALSSNTTMPLLTTASMSQPSLGNTTSGYDPMVSSALATQKAQRDLLKAEKEKTETETGAISPLKALVSLVNTPEGKQAFRGLIQKLFSTDGSVNNPEIPPAPTVLERFNAWNKGKGEKWSDVGLKDAERDAAKLGLEGKEKQKYVERRRRLWNGKH